MFTHSDSHIELPALLASPQNHTHTHRAQPQEPDIQIQAPLMPSESSNVSNIQKLKMYINGTFLVAQRLTLLASTAEGTGSIPGLGTKTLHAMDKQIECSTVENMPSCAGKKQGRLHSHLQFTPFELP